jgi:hypothetical protein
MTNTLTKRKYNNKQLAALQDIIKLRKHLTYSMGADLEVEYKEKSGDTRASGALVMTGWRMQKGYYAKRGFTA